MCVFNYLFALLFGLFCVQLAIAGGPEMPSSESGFYLTADLGGATFQDQHSNSSTVLLGGQAVTSNAISARNVLSFTWGVGVGWQFSRLFRVDVTYRYLDLPLIIHSLDTANTGALASSITTVDGHSDLYLVNGYIDLLSLFGVNVDHFQPYIGGGVGYAENKTKNATMASNTNPVVVGFIINARQSGFAYQVLAGVNFPLTTGLRIFAQYSFLCANKYVMGNTFAATVGQGLFTAPIKFRIHSSIVGAGLAYLF